MLVPPSRGFSYSAKTHNVELDAMSEWLEGCLTFVDEIKFRFGLYSFADKC